MAAVAPEDRRAVRAAAARRRSRAARRRSPTVSTVVVLGGLVALLVTSPGWASVRETFFNREAFTDSFPDVLRGFWLDVKMFVVVEVGVLILGLRRRARAARRRAPALFPLRLLAVVYTDVFRGVPTILLVYLVGFGVPALELSGLPTDPVVLGGDRR